MDAPPDPSMSASTAESPSPPPTEVLDEEELTEPPALPITTFAPKSHSFLAKRQTHLPVLVIATETAKALAWKNKLRLSDMLEGLSQDLTSIASGFPLASFRSVSRTVNFKWDDLKLAFFQPNDIAESTSPQELLQSNAALQASDGNLLEELDLLEDQVDKLLQDPKDESHVSAMDRNRQRKAQLEQVMRDAYALTSPPDIPWLWRFRVALDDSTNFLEHDMIQQPALCLLVCSSEEHEQLDAYFADLFNPYNLPQAFYGAKKLWDATSLKKEVLVLHDAVDGPTDLDLDLMEQKLKQTYGAASALLRINSIVPSMARALEAEEKSDLWHGEGKLGNCLSSNDRLVIRRYIAQLIANSLLPAMERRITDLNLIVNERKKGVRNVFRGLFRPTRVAGNDPDEKSALANDHYRYDSVESQVRLLADSLFLIKDYDAALSMYKLIRDDYKNDRALLHYASIHEMMALCVHLLDPIVRNREVFQYLETALFNYTRAAEDDRGASAGAARPVTAPVPTRLATRLCLVLTSVKSMNPQERHLEVADLLASASSHETSLGAAVLLEQSSAHYYKADMYRKYAFHMLMAGHMFRSAHQEHHAFRCFTSALYIYHDGQWDELHNHLRSALAALLYALGRMPISVELYAKLVGTTGGGRVSVKSQQKFVNHLLEICKEHSKKALVGADRMVASPTDRKRQERLQRIVEVIRATKGASRVLELPNIDLPFMDDSSITIQVEAEARSGSQGISALGNPSIGEESVWEELQSQTVAELRAADKRAAKPNEDDMSTALSSVSDVFIRRMIYEIDRETKELKMVARARKSGSLRPQPAVRARMEPLLLELEMSNPLAVKVVLKEMQLVAVMKEKGSGRLFTNEDAISIGPTSTRTWTFTSSDGTFYAPEFCRLAPLPGRRSWKSANDAEPFFVVTKANKTLEPGGKASVALSICPLVKGDLEIVGVRSKLFDEVWIFHPFHIKGALLQNTQENRANRARSDPVLLKSKVEDDMPRLSASLIASQAGDGGRFVQGEISSWTLRVSNLGTAPASKLSLKTNVPWIKVRSLAGPGKFPEHEPTSCCIGPSGTLLSLALEGEGLQSPGIIQPGEQVDIPIDIRTDGDIQQHFYMLFRYELVGGAKSSHRWLRQMVVVPIYPSLKFTASLKPSTWAKAEYNLSVEIANHRSEVIFIDKLSVASREYRLEQIGGQGSRDYEDSDVIALDVRERVSMHYRLIPSKVSSSLSLGDTCMMSECKMAGSVEGSSRQECITSDEIGYLCLESAHARFRTALRKYRRDVLSQGGDEDDQQPRHVSQIRRSRSALNDKNDLVDYAHPTSIARLFPTANSKTKIDLICCWRTSRSEVDGFRGQHHLPGLPVRSQTVDNSCPITMTCQHPNCLTHNFSVSGPACVPFEITLRNNLVETPVAFEFSVKRPKMFEVVGSEVFPWTMNGGDEVTIPLQAVIPMPGVYNLQQTHLTVTEAGNALQHPCDLQWLVMIKDSSESH